MNISNKPFWVSLFIVCTFFITVMCSAVSNVEEKIIPSLVTNVPGLSQRDGNYIAYVVRSSIDSPSSSQHIFVIRPDGDGLVKLEGHSFWNDSPTWSPDGKRLAFWSDANGNRDIYVLTLNDLSIERLTDDPAWDINPAWSPDGSKIAFASGRSGNLDIYVMDADGGNSKAITSEKTDENYPGWSPDGKQISFVDEKSLNLKLTSIEKGEEKILSQATGRAAWSPDGKKLAYAGFFYSDKDGFRQTNNPDIVVYDLDNEKHIRLTDNPGYDAFPAWSPDGKSLVFESDMGDPVLYTRSLFRIDIKGTLNEFSPEWVSRLTEGEGRMAAWSPVVIPAIMPLPVIQPAPPPLVRVCQQGCDYSSIQAAIDSAKGLVNIYVESGTYRESILVNKTVNLYGEDTGGGQPAIDADGQARAVTIQAPNVVFENFKIINTTSDTFMTAAVHVTSPHTSILNNTIASCGESTIENHAILVENSAYNTIMSNTILDGCGQVLIVNASNNLIAANRMDDVINITTSGEIGGIDLPEHVASPRFNIVAENLAAGIFLDQKVDENRIVGNILSGAASPSNQNKPFQLLRGGILLNCGPVLNMVVENKLADGAGISLLSAGSYNMILNNQIENCANGITLEGSFYELVFGNQIIGSPGFGIYTGTAVNRQTPGPEIGGGHLIFGNDLNENAVNARDDSSGASPNLANFWDNGSSGNHFSDYDDESEGCTDRNGDGICDDPYPIPEQPNVMDHFPLIKFTAGE